MKTSTKIYFVRHGKYSNPKEIFPGRLSGFGLCKEGFRQAEAAARALQGENIVAVFSSPILRTRQTARIVLSQYPNQKLQVSRHLIEVYCPYDGHPLSELEALNWDVYKNSKPPFEQRSDVLKRAQLFVSKIRQRFPGRNVVAVTHGDVISFLKLWVMGKSLTSENSQIDYPAPASIHSFTFRGSSVDEILTYEFLEPN